MDDHSTTCEYTFLPCPNECSDEDGEILRVLRKEMEKHKNEECPRRQYTCPHCKEDGEYEEMTTQHLEECPNVEVPCPNELDGCNELIIRSKILLHQRFVCQHQTVPCKYADIGCEVKMLRKDIKQHEKNSHDHLELAVEAAHDKKKTLESKMKELENTIAHLQSIILAQSKEVNELKSAMENRGDTANLMYYLDTSGYHLDQVSPNVLKFTNFAERKFRNEVVYSPPFYTSPGGYKMCLQVNANGSGKGKDTHVSVFVHLMRGENDDHLTWPFTGTVVIELLNQLNDKIHQKVTIQFMGDQKSSQRVENSDRAASGRGYTQFISHSSLAIAKTDNPYETQYLKDDSLYFRYKVTCQAPKPWLTAASKF